MDNNGNPIKFLISSAIKSQSKPLLVNPMVRASPLMTDLLKNKELSPKSSNESLSGHKSVSPLALYFKCKTTIENETQTETAIMCGVECQTIIVLADKETQTENNTIDLQLMESLPETKEFVENSTQTSELSENESGLRNCEQIIYMESNESLIELSENSSETETRSSTISETSTIKEEINALEIIENNINNAQNIPEKIAKNEEILIKSTNNRNINKNCCSIS